MIMRVTITAMGPWARHVRRAGIWSFNEGNEALDVFGGKFYADKIPRPRERGYHRVAARRGGLAGSSPGCIAVCHL